MTIIKCNTCFIFLAAIAAIGAAHAQYPARPVRIIVPTSPGAGADLSARVIAHQLSERFGQQVFVENRAGATTMIGTELVAKWTADGGAGSARLGVWMRPGSGL